MIRFRDILSIQSQEGKEQLSASSKAKGAIRGRPYTEVSEGKYDVPYQILLTKWTPLNKVLFEIEMVKNDDGTSSLSEDSKAKLQSQDKHTSSKLASVEDLIQMMSTLKQKRCWKTQQALPLRGIQSEV